MNKKGFTLIELLTVIFILGIVITIAVTSIVGIYNSIKRKALEEKIEVIEEAAILFGENRKENIIKSTSIYNDSPCKSFKLRELVPNYIENDTDEECINSDNKNEVGCIIDPSDKNNYLDEIEVIVFYKNKRIYSVVDINDELVCENTELTPEIKEFYLEAGKEETVNHTDVSAYLSWDTENIKYYCLIEENNTEKCIWNNVNGKSVTSEYTLSNGDGEKIVYAFIKDKYENLSEGKSYTINLDTTAPTGNSININDSEYTNSREVTLTISSNGAKEMCVSNTNTCDDWKTYATSKEWTLTSGDGTKTIYVWFRDEYGNTSEYVTDTITLDTSAPTNNGVTINGGDSYTTSATVTLTLTSTGASEMCISNTTSCSSWITYSTSKSWTLTENEGEKTVYVWYRDLSGNESEYVSDTITYDSGNPTLTVTAPTGTTSSSPTYVKNSSYTVSGTATDNNGIESVTVNGTKVTLGTNGTFSLNLTLTEGVVTTVTVIAKDKAGKSTTVTRYVSYDISAPTNNSIRINNSEYTNSTSVTLYLSSSGASQMCISNTTSCSSWEAYSTSKSWSLNNSTNGTKTVYAWFRDGAGNTTSSYVSDTITLDTEAPTNNSVKINGGATATTNSIVTLTLASTGATQMCISNTTSCSSWQTYTTSKSWTLLSGHGQKTVYVWFRDAVGNTSSRISASVTYSIPFGEYLINNQVSGLMTTSVYELYRYSGDSVNNYVKLGDVLYRIIGVQSEDNSTLGLEKYQVKLVKAEALPARVMAPFISKSLTWEETDLYSYLQTSNILGNSSVIPSSWVNKIDSIKWYIGFEVSNDGTLPYIDAKSKISTNYAKVGLVYLHDFGIELYDGIDSDWMYRIGWTMTLTGYVDVGGGLNNLAYEQQYEDLGGNYTSTSMVYSPSFYLIKDVVYKSGDGSPTTPYIIE